MLTRFERPECSKELYFKLSGSLQICSYDNCSKTLKLAGIYAIFNGDVCLYVGQSQNVASRLSQHLFGRYSGATEIVVFPVAGNGFSDFYDRSKDSRKSILENNEFKFIEHYKPIGNLVVPGSDHKYNEKGLFDCLENDKEEFYAYGHVTIYITEHDIDVTTGIGSYELVGEVYKGHNEWVVNAYKYYGDELFDREIL
jgi:hypothetical protein